MPPSFNFALTFSSLVLISFFLVLATFFISSPAFFICSVLLLTSFNALCISDPRQSLRARQASFPERYNKPSVSGVRDRAREKGPQQDHSYAFGRRHRHLQCRKKRSLVRSEPLMDIKKIYSFIG